MKVEVKSKKGLRTILSVIVDKKSIQTKMEEKLGELQKEVALKGFRPGKVPPAKVRTLLPKFGSFCKSSDPSTKVRTEFNRIVLTCF